MALLIKQLKPTLNKPEKSTELKNFNWHHTYAWLFCLISLMGRTVRGQFPQIFEQIIRRFAEIVRLCVIFLTSRLVGKVYIYKLGFVLTEGIMCVPPPWQLMNFLMFFKTLDFIQHNKAFCTHFDDGFYNVNPKI